MLVIQRVIWLDMVRPSLFKIWEFFLKKPRYPNTGYWIREIHIVLIYSLRQQKQIFIIIGKHSWTFFFLRCSGQLVRPFVLGDRRGQVWVWRKPWLWICKQRKRNCEKWKWKNSEKWKWKVKVWRQEGQVRVLKKNLVYGFANRGKETVKRESLVVIYLQTEEKK